MKRSILVCASVFALSGCYVETMQQDKKDKDNKDLWRQDTCATGQLQTEIGCLQISLPAAPGLQVSSKHFRDAAAFGQTLSEWIPINDTKAVDDPNTPEKEVATYKIEAVQTVTNENWAKDFRLYVKGPKGFSASSNFSQGFTINNLPEGTDYQARLQKEVVVDVVRSVTKKKEGEEAKPVVTTFRRCITLYKEFAFDVVGTKKTSLQYDEFDMYKPTETCASDVVGDPSIDL